MSVTVSGIMINPVGEPVINAQITLTAVANSLTVLNAFSATVRTDSTGAYAIQLEEGSYAITVAANGRSFVYGTVTLDNTTGPSTLNQLLKQQIMESELTPDVILYFRQIQQQMANALATIRTLEIRATNAEENVLAYRNEVQLAVKDLGAAKALVARAHESAVSADNFWNEAQRAASDLSQALADAKMDAAHAEAACEVSKQVKITVVDTAKLVVQQHSEITQAARAAAASQHEAN
ncbi:TPA: prophage tail fiber N-terminal domain-containing protein, partial [Yersinia enterocolitica]|nr:prophage tail fiber N-terminal domain-containing protein [Yersinia enterocolitica]